jgi:methyl-accepting chemotaxis protein
MTERDAEARNSENEILQQQYLRALSSFEGIVLSQIDIKNKLGDRLNYSIRTGLIILSVIAVSILVLLLTLSSQITRISGVVASMNTHFSQVSDKMHHITEQIVVMEGHVSLLHEMEANTGALQSDMALISQDMTQVRASMQEVDQALGQVRERVGGMSMALDRMSAEVGAMSVDMQRLSQPARSFNKMMPFP